MKKLSVLLPFFLLLASGAAAQTRLGTPVFIDGPPAGKTSFSGCATGSESPSSTDTTFEYEVFLQTNNHRAQNGLPPYKWSFGLSQSARYHAEDMATDNYFEHDSYDCADANLFDQNDPPCSPECSFGDRIRPFFSWVSVAENIAFNQFSPTSVMNAWKNSPGHNSNLLHPNMREMGVGYVLSQATGHQFWVQNFGRRSGVFPLVINLDSLSTQRPLLDLFLYRPDTSWDEVQFRVNGGSFGAFQPFPADSTLSLDITGQPAGLVQVEARLRQSGSNQTMTIGDDIFFQGVTSRSGPPALAGLRVFPNPARNQLVVSAPELAGKEIRLVDLRGRRLQAITASGARETLDVSALAPGLYLLRAGSSVRRVAVR